MHAWWFEHRNDARTMFIDELEETLRRLLAAPDAGMRWPTPRRPNLRRVLMPRTHNHVYFLFDEARKTVFVLAVWGAPRGRSPKL